MSYSELRKKCTQWKWQLGGGSDRFNANCVYDDNADLINASSVCSLYGVCMHADLESVRGSARDSEGFANGLLIAHEHNTLPKVLKVTDELYRACEMAINRGELSADIVTTELMNEVLLVLVDAEVVEGE